jgi:predicted DsbA family dithiol-disulfide isomerase
VQVEIWSDIVCPWCYLGKRRFEKALAEFEHRDAVSVSYRSFQLDASRPRGETISRRQMLMKKYRLSPEQVEEMDERMEETAAADGLEYHLTEAGLTGNTFDAHQVVHLARAHGLESAMLDRLYRAYFTEQRSIFDHESLVALAAEVGIDAADAREALRQNRFADAVANDVDEAGFYGATGVPFFVVAGRYGVSGAQPVDLFSKVLTRAWTEIASDADTAKPAADNDA